MEDGEKAQTVEMVKRVTVSLTPRAFLALQLVGAQGQETASHEICQKIYKKEVFRVLDPTFVSSESLQYVVPFLSVLGEGKGSETLGFFLKA